LEATNLEKLSLVFFNAEPPQFHTCIHTSIFVLQGNAATKLRCGGKFFILVISYFLLIPTVKNFLKRLTFAIVTVKIKVAQFFLTHSVVW